MLFNGKIFGNVDWNYCHLKPETDLKHGKRQRKGFDNYDMLYVVEKVMKSSIQM